MAEVVVAVITAFVPGEGFVDLVRSLLPQVARVIVVDDGSPADARPVLEAAREAGAQLVRHEQNLGIAAALNTGAAEARCVAGARHLLTFDQDSSVDDDFAGSLVSALEAALAAGVPAGLAAPERVEGLPGQAVRSLHGQLIGRTPIQSGLLVPFSTLDAVGDFAEDLFIDGVDTDFALRAAGAGLAVVLARGVELGHSLGSGHPVTLFGRPLAPGGRPLTLTHSAPFRYYYLVRNRVLLNRRRRLYRDYRPVIETLADLRHLVVVSLFVPGRVLRLKAAGAGLRDGWAGRSGRIPGPLRERLRR